MTIPFPLKNTIDSRRSARCYKMIGVENDVMETIKDYANSLSVPFDHNIEIKFFKADPTKTLYTLMTSPPDNIAFVAETDIVSISKAGFIGELLILFAQSKDISTCWYGHYKQSELERLMPHLQSTHPNVDIGICACHVWLGLIDKGYNPNVTVNEEAGRAVWSISI